MTINIGAAVGHIKDPRSFGEAKTLIDSYTYIGVEVELEGILVSDITNKCPLLNDVHDYSLRGADSREILFAFPLKGSDVEEAVLAIESYVTKLDVRPIISNRTSTHVHIDVRDMSILQLRKFLAVYVSVERMLFHYCGREREENIFCVPLYKAATTLENISELLQAKDSRAFGHILNDKFGEHKRYGAVNLNAINKHGTLEFRMLRGEWRYKPIMEWINIILSIKKYALTAKTKEILVPSHVYENNCNRYVDKVFGKLAGVLKYEGYERDIVKGARASQDIINIKNITENSWDVIDLGAESNVLSTRNKEVAPVEEPNVTSFTIPEGILSSSQFHNIANASVPEPQASVIDDEMEYDAPDEF